MSLQPSKSDQDFTKILIANQDVLLSPTLEQPNDTSFEIFSFLNNELNLNDQQTGTANISNMLTNSYQTPDILDANLFEILRADDPEIVSLLESIDKSDIQIGFLPQISVNTASKLLDEQPAEALDNTIKPDANIHYQTVQLKTEIPDDVSSPQTRTSQRLLKKKEKNIKIEPSDSKPKATTNKRVSKIKPENRLNLKRKRSIDDDDDSNCNSSEIDSVDFNSSQNSTTSSTSNKYMMTKHNDNSIDFESDDHIYYDDDDDDDEEHTLNNENDFFDDEDQDKEFKDYVRNYSMTSRNRAKKLDPTKKESNKEAATRYRLKKLSEKERLFETRMLLENENSEVKRKIEITQTEINYLKNLLVQMLLTKGLLGNKI